jgi:hypothetical protein
MAVRDLSRELFGSHLASFGVADDNASDDATAVVPTHGRHPHQQSVTETENSTYSARDEVH